LDTAPAPIRLDLPIPPSVNRLRRMDGAGNRRREEFYRNADGFLMQHGPRPAPVRLITGAYEIQIQIPETLSRIDLDNHCKALLDYLVSREFVPDDDKRHLRRLVVEWGSPSAACRIDIRPIELTPVKEER
jgi:Holliday junction resolvase RusA-like endonuclease